MKTSAIKFPVSPTVAWTLGTLPQGNWDQASCIPFLLLETRYEGSLCHWGHPKSSRFILSDLRGFSGSCLFLQAEVGGEGGEGEKGRTAPFLCPLGVLWGWELRL